MKKNKVSIIIPCYNTESYINRCLDSIINQSYKNIEIICINDGSTDNTVSIINDYKKKYNKIKLINKKNGGVSSARNIGIKNASGDYILFVDSDDFVDKELVSTLCFEAIQNKADIVKCNRTDVYLKKNAFIKRKPLWETKRVIDSEDYYSVVYPEFFNRNKLCTIFMTLIKSDLLKNNNIMFNEELSVDEDEIFSAEIFSKSKRFVYLPNNLYFYVKNDNGLSSDGANIYLRVESRKKSIALLKNISKEWNIFDYKNMVVEKTAFVAMHTALQTSTKNRNYKMKEQYKLFYQLLNDDTFFNSINISKYKIMLFPEKILCFMIKHHLYFIGFIYARFFQFIYLRLRYIIDNLRYCLWKDYRYENN